MSGYLSDLIDVRRTVQNFVQGYSQITSGVDPFDCFPEECNWSGLDEAPSCTLEVYRGALRHINGDSPLAQPQLKVIEIRFQVADKQRRLARRGYDGRIVRVEG